MVFFECAALTPRAGHRMSSDPSHSNSRPSSRAFLVLAIDIFFAVTVLLEISRECHESNVYPNVGYYLTFAEVC